MVEIACAIGVQSEADGGKLISQQCLALIYAARGLQVDPNVLV